MHLVPELDGDNLGRLDRLTDGGDDWMAAGIGHIVVFVSLFGQDSGLV